MASQQKTIQMSQTGGSWDGVIDVTVDTDSQNSRVTVTAVMTVYETDGGSPKEGIYRFFVYIDKDGQLISSGGSESAQYDLYLTDRNAGGCQRSCSATFTCEDSCRVTVGGWAICDSGALGGCAVSGSEGWEVTVRKPASTISLDKTSVQMGKKLIITLNREQQDYTHSLFYKFGTGSETALASGIVSSYSWTVPDLAHLCKNATGGTCTLKAVTYSGTVKIGQTETTVYLTVPDATTPSVENSALTLGQKHTVGCKRGSASFTQKLSLLFQGNTYQIREGAVDSAEWTPGYALAKLIPKLTYGTGTLQCATYNGTALVGTGTATVRVNVPENSTTRPAFTLQGLTLSPVSNLGETFAGIYIRGRTGLTARMSASSEYSSIAGYTVTVGNQTATGNPATVDPLVSEGTVKVTAKVTDARGFSTSVTTSVYIHPYRNPRVIPYPGYSHVICERAKSTWELSPQGTYLGIRAGKSFSSVTVGGAEKNSCTLRYRWKISGSGSYSGWITLLAAGSKETSVSLLISNVVSSLQTSYLVELEAADALGGKHTLTFQIMTEAVSFVLYDGPDGAGFGKYPEAPHVVDIASHMTLLVRGSLVVVGENWTDLGLADGVSEAAASCGRKTDPGCHIRVENGKHILLAFDCSFDYNGTAVRISRDPIPADCRPHRTAYGLCPVNDRGIALVSAGTDGHIRAEWIQKLTDTAATAAAPVIWLDGYLDYWI